jgi:hypothetical protein
MGQPPEGPVAPVFSPRDWMDLYARGRYDELSECFLTVLRHFRNTTYVDFDDRRKYYVNEFLKHFLSLFTQDDYAPSRNHLLEFVRLNLTTSNLVAVSSFGTTDPYLDLMAGRPASLGKVLALLSARNSAAIDRASFFDADPVLASAWYGAYAETYRSGLLRADVVERLKEHFAFRDDRLDVRFMSLDSYFASTYVNGDPDRRVKPVINRAVKALVAGESARVRNRPDPRKVAVFSGNWSPAHSVYRINHAYLQALEGYHLTFFPLGRRRDMDVSLFDEVRPLDFDRNGVMDVRPLLDNEFSVAYFPDVGLTPQSILLANMRIAPIQICSLGHSASTWGAEIDYVFSGADVEPPDRPERNYSERLVLLPGCGAVHDRPDYAPAGRRKAGTEFLLNCPWNAQKVNARFCRTLQELIRGSRREVRLRLFVGTSLDRRNDYLPFVRDLRALLGGRHVEVYRGLPYRDYMALMEEGDVTLDSYPFGGCNTVADSLYLRRLTVTWEGDKWYNRIGPRMLRMAGLPELAAASEDEYLGVTLALIHDDAHRASLQERLDRADLDGTVFSTADARYFPKAIGYLIENHDRLRGDPDCSPIRIGR